MMSPNVGAVTACHGVLHLDVVEIHHVPTRG
jgi:hypothetical protein